MCGNDEKSSRTEKRIRQRKNPMIISWIETLMRIIVGSPEEPATETRLWRDRLDTPIHHFVEEKRTLYAQVRKALLQPDGPLRW